MSEALTRKKHTGEPGNGGQFGQVVRSEPASVGLVGRSTELPPAHDIDPVLMRSQLAADSEQCLAVLNQGTNYELGILAQVEIEDSGTAEEVFEALAESDHPLILDGLAKNPALPKSCLETLVRYARSRPQTHARFAHVVAAHRNVTLSAAAELASHPDAEVRQILAANTQAPASVLNDLASRDVDDDVAATAWSTLREQAFLETESRIGEFNPIH